jgi:hypothetical protein
MSRLPTRPAPEQLAMERLAMQGAALVSLRGVVHRSPGIAGIFHPATRGACGRAENRTARGSELTVNGPALVLGMVNTSTGHRHRCGGGCCPAGCSVTDEADKSHRFALTGKDPESRNRTIILWREVDLIGGTVVRRVVVTLDAMMHTATVLTCPEAIEVAEAILAAAR